VKFELKSIGYWPLIKVSFLINLIVGFIGGLFFALFMGLMFSLIDQFGGMPGMPPMYTEEMAPIGVMLVLYPFMFAIGGAVFYTIFFLIIAFIYNLIAKLVGGLEFTLKEVQLQPVGYPTQPPPMYAQAQPQQTPPPPTRPTPPPPPPPVEPLPPDVTPPDDKPDDKERL